METTTQRLLNRLPHTITDEIDDEVFYLHMSRVGDDSKPSWFVYYGNDEDHDMQNGELTGTGLTLDEALQELLDNLPAYETWKLEQRQQSNNVNEADDQ